MLVLTGTGSGRSSSSGPRSSAQPSHQVRQQSGDRFLWVGVSPFGRLVSAGFRCCLRPPLSNKATPSTKNGSQYINDLADCITLIEQTWPGIRAELPLGMVVEKRFGRIPRFHWRALPRLSRGP